MKFGTDGIRGIYGTELTNKHAFLLGCVLAKIAKRDSKGVTSIVVGRDTRHSCKALLSAFCCGAQKFGAKIYDLGIVPTPAVQFFLKEESRYAFGLMITASHNAEKYNGLKVFCGGGTKLTEAQEREIETMLSKRQANFEEITVQTNKVRRTKYVEFLRQNLLKTNAKIAIDCANGSAYKIAKQVFDGFSVVWLSTNPNGRNINQNCGSTHIKKLQNQVAAAKCKIGFAFDGDADRCLAVDENGNIISGDHILYILAKAMKRDGRLFGGVVATELSSLSLEQSLREEGILFTATKTGDKYVQREMKERNWNLGGEQSGHIIIGDKMTTGDGILTAIELINELTKSKLSASKLSKGFTPLKRVELNIEGCKNYSDNIKQVVCELNNSLVGERVLIRKSGTENVIRIMCESGSLRRARMFATYFQALIEN